MDRIDKYIHPIASLLAALCVAPVVARAQCPGDLDGDNQVAVSELITAVDSALIGCPQVPPFIDNLDGTVTDTQTGLMWEQKTSGSGCLHCVEDAYHWNTDTGTTPSGDAYTSFLYRLNNRCANNEMTPCVGDSGCFSRFTGFGKCGFAGHRDWRLPEIGQDGGQTELESIVDLNAPFCGSGGACIAPGFGASKASFYFSSTTNFSTGRPWIVNFLDGSELSADFIDPLFVRAVRSAR